MAHEQYGEEVGAARLMGYLGKATQWGRELWVPGEDNGGIPVNVQDQHTRALDLDFIQAAGVPTTLTVETALEDMTITIADTTGFDAGNVVGIFSGEGFFYFGKQIGAPAGQVVTLDTPIDKKFTTALSAVITATDELAVNGSVTTEIFQIGPVGVPRDLEVDITRITGYIQSGSAMDDALFGNLAALTNGVVLRVNNEVIDNVWNIKSNGDIGLLCFDAAYTDKAPAGSFGYRFRNTYAGPSKHGVTLRLMGGEMLEVLIQDNLSGLESFRMMAQGHVVTD